MGQMILGDGGGFSTESTTLWMAIANRVAGQPVAAAYEIRYGEFNCAADVSLATPVLS